MADKSSYPTLDRSRDFGVVFPPENGAHFVQDGFHFGQMGDIAEDMLTADDRARLERMLAKKAADAAAEKARRAYLAKAGIDADAPDMATKILDAAVATAANSGDGSDIDLVAWARGEKAYPFAKVRGAASEQHNFLATDARALVAFMVDNKLIDPDQVKVRAV